MNFNYFLSFDLGASSGRAIAGVLESGKLTLIEVYRFKNQMISVHGSNYWNIFTLFGELVTGLRKCIDERGIMPQSIGIDTWGVDYLFLNRRGRIAGLPFAYRDGRTNGMMELFFNEMNREETYRLSGIQFMQFNTLFQLYSSVVNRDPELLEADKMLFIPDALNYLFTGIKKNEYTIASTAQLLKPGKVTWEERLFNAAGIDTAICCDLVSPGTILGPVLPEIQRETGCGEIPCIAVASHDTASAVVSVPAEGDGWAYLSSGTWSLLGIESSCPLVSDKTLSMNFTNEGGVEGTTRFLKNIMGMWLIQECKRLWDYEK
jgi:rhamnulokinase